MVLKKDNVTFTSLWGYGKFALHFIVWPASHIQTRSKLWKAY